MDRDPSKSPEYLSTLERGLTVLHSFAGQTKSLTLSQVAERTDLSPAVVRRCLLTLEHLGYVSKMDGRFALSPDCGLKYLPRDVSRGKLDAMVAGARILRERHG